jgi:hypothetical protein
MINLKNSGTPATQRHVSPNAFRSPQHSSCIYAYENIFAEFQCVERNTYMQCV